MGVSILYVYRSIDRLLLLLLLLLKIYKQMFSSLCYVFNFHYRVPWGELVGEESFETLSKIYTGYGEDGPSQGKLHKNGMNDEMKKEFPKLDYMNKCVVIDEAGSS